MSATGRGGERSPLDFYETPKDAIDVFLLAGGLGCDFDRKMTIVDAGCGTGAITHRLMHFFPRATIYGSDVEFRPELFDRCPKVLFLGGDFLDEWLPQPTFAPIDAVVMNPPYAIAQEFIEHALKITDGPVCALLRLNFLEGEARWKWLRDHVPDVWVLANRPSFMRSVSCVLKKECGYQAGFALTAPWPRVCPMCGSATKSTMSDATAYAWMVWRREERTVGEVRILK